MRRATRNVRHLLVRSGSAPATNSSLDVSLLLSASDINQSTYICTALSHVQRLCTIRRTPTKPFKPFPVSVQTPQKRPTGPTTFKISKRKLQEVILGMSETLNFTLCHPNPPAQSLRAGSRSRDSQARGGKLSFCFSKLQPSV